jgi:hypothetical protein
MQRILVLVVLVGQAAVAAAQPPPPPERRDGRALDALRQNVQKLFGAMRQLSDWDTHRAYIVDAVEKVYARNGWDSEPDAFSLSLIREVSTIPPWSPQERFDKMVQVLSDRYLFDERQEQRLRETMIRESTELFMRHSDRIAQYAVEALQARAAGEAFTPEQIARWVQLAEPVFRDSRQRLTAAAEQFAAELDPDQRELMKADLGAMNRRMGDVEQMTQRWARGEWQPSDWGMEDDPIQLAGEARAGTGGEPQPDSVAPPGVGRGQPGVSQPAEPRQASPDHRPRRAGPDSEEGASGESVPPGAEGAAPGPAGQSPGISPVRPREAAGARHLADAASRDPWADYVRRFIEKYRLDEAQQGRAWKIYRDVRTRGDRYEKVYGERIEAARRHAASGDDEAAQRTVRETEAQQKAAMDRLFEQLKRRLERLPTRAQLRDAGPTPLEPPDSQGKQPAPRTDTGGP